jgi:hypothetical protein
MNVQRENMRKLIREKKQEGGGAGWVGGGGVRVRHRRRMDKTWSGGGRSGTLGRAFSALIKVRSPVIRSIARLHERRGGVRRGEERCKEEGRQRDRPAPAVVQGYEHALDARRQLLRDEVVLRLEGQLM